MGRLDKKLIKYQPSYLWESLQYELASSIIASKQVLLPNRVCPVERGHKTYFKRRLLWQANWTGFTLMLTRWNRKARLILVTIVSKQGWTGIRHDQSWESSCQMGIPSFNTVIRRISLYCPHGYRRIMSGPKPDGCNGKSCRLAFKVVRIKVRWLHGAGMKPRASENFHDLWIRKTTTWREMINYPS